MDHTGQSSSGCLDGCCSLGKFGPSYHRQNSWRNTMRLHRERRASAPSCVCEFAVCNEWKKHTAGVCLHGDICFGQRWRFCYQITFYVLRIDRIWTTMVLTACVWPTSGWRQMEKCIYFSWKGNLWITDPKLVTSLIWKRGIKLVNDRISDWNSPYDYVGIWIQYTKCRRTSKMFSLDNGASQ